ncbi:MAG: hypothetical protein RLZ13_1372 [Bacteroidota bacterium]|jgi:hypothetical protein
MSTPSIQHLLAESMLRHFPDALVKKKDVDNFLDIHVPSIHQKKGTHIFFNTSNQKIKIGFYCREEEFVEQALSNGAALVEKYSQGVRLKDNPEFADVETAIAATLKFMEVLGQKSAPSGGAKQQKTETYTFKKAVDAYLQGNIDYVAAYVQAGNPVLQFNGDVLITNELISYVCTYTEVDQRIADLVEAGVDLNESFDDGEGYTAVHFAAWDGKDEILAYLLEAGAKADVVGEDGYTPLLLAVAGNHTACIEQLVESGAAVNIRVTDANIYFSKQGGSPLTVSFINGYLTTALYLIEQGADPFVLVEPCQNAPSPNLFVNFLNLVKQGMIDEPEEGQLSKILSLVGIDIDENSIVEDSSAEESQDNEAQLDLNEFLKELGASAEEASNDEEEEGTHLDEMIKKFVEHQGSDKILEVLEEYYAQKGDIVVVEIDADDLINSLSTTDDFVDFVVISGIIKLTANTVWADLAKLIGESEVDWVKTLVQMENPDTMVLFYCEGNYVYAFSNMNANENVNGEDTSEEETEESQPGLDLASFLKSMEHEENADESEEDPEEVMRESAAYLQSDADDSDEEEDDELGYPMIFWSGENINQEQLENYAYKWQTKSSAYAWVGGISGFIPDWFEEFISDAICPSFTSKELLTISNRVLNEKIIPVLKYAPEELFFHVKTVWWIVPFCIWKEDTASFVFIDKNGFYSLFKNKEGDVAINFIFPWDKVASLEFETEYDADPNVNRLTLFQDNGGFLTFDEFVGLGEDGKDRGSYLSVVESIWEARKDTIEASSGLPMWYEGKGGEGFKEFEKPQDLLKEAKWKKPFRPDPGMYGG